MILTINDDLDLAKIADSGQCFRWERQEDNSYRILHGSHCLYAASLGGSQYEFSCDEKEFSSIWRDYLDLNENYASIRSRIEPDRDPFLFAAMEQEKGIRILRQDSWEMLITFIISQNRNIPAIRRSVQLLSEACGQKKLDSRGMEYFAFPEPEAVAALDEEALTACRLGYRCKYVHAAAAAVSEGTIDLDSLIHEEEEKTLKTLTSLYGVGIKVANCVSLFGLHHIDAFPKDVWINRILEAEYPNGYPFEEYSPYNGVYQQYMYAYYRNRA